ncbi:MAG: NIPSNAP family protein [Syntrophomonadaceae bacterium]|jgi:hypothetical protein
MKLYEMRTYTLKPGSIPKYSQYFNEIGAPIITKYLKLVGFWYTEIGTLNQLVSIWEYDSFEERAEKRKALYQDEKWLNDFLPLVMPMFIEQKNQIMYGLQSSPIK